MSRYLNKDIIANLSQLEISARLIADGIVAGRHKSSRHGFNMEFNEYRKYTQGDDLRSIDWKAYARTDRLYIKQFEDESNLQSYIIMDASASMGNDYGGITKFEYGKYIVAALSWLMLRQGEAVGFASFSDDIRGIIPARSNMDMLKYILKELDDGISGGITNVNLFFKNFASILKGRAMVIIITDLLNEPEVFLKNIKSLRAKKNEVIIFHILDPAELNFPYHDEVMFIDAETEERIKTNTDEIAVKYRNLIRNFINNFRRECSQNDIEYVFTDTSLSYQDFLIKYLSGRAV